MQSEGPIDHEKAPGIRDKLAKRVIEMALGNSALGVDELRDDVLAYLRSNPPE